MLTGLLVGKQISGVIRGIATGLILEHSCSGPLHPAFTQWHEMSLFCSSGSFTNKSRKIILPKYNSWKRIGVRNGKVLSGYFGFFFNFCLK